MSVDLSVAVEAAAQAHLMTVAQRNDYREPLRWDDLNPIQQHALREHVLPYVAAAAPLIEAQVRSQVAAEIRARIVAEPLLMYDADWRDGMETAAEIAGGADA